MNQPEVVLFVQFSMSAHCITRAHLKSAVENQQWDLLDKMLELDASHINEKSYFTDNWGEWWGLLLECVRNGQEPGVRILLKHGADRRLGNWGDCLPETPLEAAAGKPEILALLKHKAAAAYKRKSDPPIPEPSAVDARVNLQGEIEKSTGMVFPVEGLE